MPQRAGEIPPIRRDPSSEDGDSDRISFVEDLFEEQGLALQQWEKQVEENVRMLAGQQWMVYSDLLSKWIDISEFFTDQERRWRQRPVVNRLLFWFMLTKARMTENPPIMTFQPSTGDVKDAQLAEVMDPIFKTIWSEIGMLEKLDKFFSWLLVSGTAYLKSRVDLSKGELREWYGPATVTIEDEDGEEQDVFVPIAPFDEDGNPQVEVSRNGQGFEFEFTGEPFREREGGLNVDIPSPLQIRGEWGPQPWHEKRWHIQKSLLPPERVREKYGVECEPDTSASSVSGAGELERLLFGAGYYGAAENDPGAGGSAGENKELVTVYELWHRPTDAVDGMEETPRSPGGRLLICTPNKVIRDGPRPVRLPYTSPIQRLDFVNLPGRPKGTTPQEMLNPIQRTYNRGVAQILEHRNLVSNPVVVLDEESGIDKEQYTNKPGLILKVNKRPGVRPIEYAEPPNLSEDVFRTQGMLQDEMAFLGNLSGVEGEPPTRDASGELVKELRFNSDRFTGPVLRRAVTMLSRVAEDWIAFLPTIWDREKTIAYAGEDQVTRTLTVYPDLFENGKVDIDPEIESMLPEGRGERQAKVYRMWQDGAFGPPEHPEARRKFLKLMRFPHMERAAEPGGTHRRTAKKENGQMLKGVPADDIPVLRWYDHQVHLQVHEEFMASPEFLDQPEHVQFAFEQHISIHEQELQKELMQQLQLQALMGGEGEGQPSAGGETGGGSGGETGPGAGDVAGVGSVVPRGPNEGGGLGPPPATSEEHRPESVGGSRGAIR